MAGIAVGVVSLTGIVLGTVFGGKDKNNGATNTVRNINQVFTSVINEQIMDCTSEVTNIQTATVTNILGTGDVTIRINQELTNELHTSCAFSAQAENNISTDISNQVSQIAETISTGFGPTIPAENISELINQVGTQIRNEFMQVCRNKLVNSQSILVEDISGGNILIELDQKSNSKVVTNCIGDSSQVSDVTAILENIFDQSAKSTSRSILWGVFWTMIAVSLLLFIFFVFGKMFFTASTTKNVIIVIVVITICFVIIGLLFMATMYAVDGWPAAKDSERPQTNYDGEYDSTIGGFKCLQDDLPSEHPKWTDGDVDIISGHCVATHGYNKEEGLKGYDAYLRPFVGKEEEALGGVTCEKGKYFMMDKDGVSGDPWTCVDMTDSSKIVKNSKKIIAKGPDDDQGYQNTAQVGGSFKMSKYDTIWESESDYEDRKDPISGKFVVGDEMVGFKWLGEHGGNMRVPHMRNTVLMNAALDKTRGNCPFTVLSSFGESPTTNPKIYNGACCISRYYDKNDQPDNGNPDTGTLCNPNVEDNQNACVEWHFKHMNKDKFACDPTRMYPSMPGIP